MKHNNYDYVAVAEKTGNIVNPNVIAAYEFLWDKQYSTQDGVNLFFKQNKNGAYFYFILLSLADLWNIDTFDTFINNLKGISEDQLASLVLSFWLDYNIKEDPQYNSKTICNSQHLHDMVQQASPDPIVKWEIFSFLNNPRRILDSFISFIQSYKLKMDIVYGKHGQDIEAAKNRLLSCLEKHGIDCIKHRIRTIKTDLNTISSINLNISFMNEFIFYSTWNDKTLNIVIGTSQSLMPLEASLDDIDIIKVLTILGDPVRAKIFVMLKEETLYMREIANKLNLSLPTISHHANMLLNAEILTSYSDGRKIYLHANMETINRFIEFLKKNK